MAVILLEDDGAKKIPTQHQIWKYDSMKTLHPDSSGGGDRGVKKNFSVAELHHFCSRSGSKYDKAETGSHILSLRIESHNLTLKKKFYTEIYSSYPYIKLFKMYGNNYDWYG
jgi:hypothetical protein